MASSQVEDSRQKVFNVPGLETRRWKLLPLPRKAPEEANGLLLLPPAAGRLYCQPGAGTLPMLRGTSVFVSPNQS